MNTNLIEKEIATINSKEVAEMMEMEHSNLIKKINKINKDFNEVKINLVDYWLESSYVDKKGEERKCYEVTKMGCEFLAHKSTGTKGNIFTARYMQKFNEMEKALQNVHIESYRIEDPIERAKKWIEEETVRREQAKLIEEQTPKVEFCENVLESKNTYNITQIAKDYGLSAKKLNIILNDLGVQYRSNNQWVLYSKYQNMGYVESYTNTNENGYAFTITKWTQKGRMFLYKILKENGYAPVKELN